MTNITRLRSESDQRTTDYRFNIVVGELATTSTAGVSNLVQATFKDDAPEAYLSINEFEQQFIDSFESVEQGETALREGRQWIADSFYASDGDTLRTLRLKKGLSQSSLAKLLNTSQPHIARIERGNGGLLIETCRKLCEALDVDLNTLDAALRCQEFQVCKTTK